MLKLNIKLGKSTFLTRAQNEDFMAVSCAALNTVHEKNGRKPLENAFSTESGYLPFDKEV